MSIKKTLIALTIAHAGMVSASDKQRMVGKVLETLIATPIVAAGLVGLEASFRKSYRNPYGYAHYAAGPLGVTTEAEMLAHGIHPHAVILKSSDNSLKWQNYDFGVVNDLINNKLKDQPEACTVNKLDRLYKANLDFLRDKLPKEFKKQAFLRNFVAITVGKSFYDLYLSTKNEKHS